MGVVEVLHVLHLQQGLVEVLGVSLCYCMLGGKIEFLNLDFVINYMHLGFCDR